MNDVGERTPVKAYVMQDEIKLFSSSRLRKDNLTLLGHYDALAAISVITVLKTAGSLLFLLPLGATVETFAPILVAPDLNPATTLLTDLIINTGSYKVLYSGAVVLAGSFQEAHKSHL